MNFWAAVVIIVAIGTISEIYRSKLKANANKSEKFYDSTAQRIARLEDRMANLETIVLEKEKAKKFSDM
jgi:hypothetical protein